MQRRIALTALTAALSLTACGGPSGTGTLTPSLAHRHTKDVTGGGFDFSMYDAPLSTPGLQVNLALTEIDAVAADGSTVPVASYPSEQIVNLIALQTTPMNVEATIPANSYTGLKLVVDPANSTIVSNGQSSPLAFPSQNGNGGGWQNGHNGQKWGYGGSSQSTQSSFVAINIPMPFTVQAGMSTYATADFNVLESLTFGAYGGGWMNPHVIASANAGSVTGQLVNTAGQPVSGAAVQAVDSNGNVVNTATSNGDGSFRLRALPAGTYQIVVQNSYVSGSGNQATATNADSGASPSTTVTVTPGNQSNVGQLAD